MAQGTSSSFANFKILIGDGADPEVFAPICGLTSKGLSGSANVTTSEVPDCTDEDLPSWQEQDVNSIGMTLSGSGMWTAEAHGTLLNWFLDGTRKNIKVQYANAADGDPEYLAGPAVLSKLDNAVAKGARLTADITLNFAQKPAVTNAGA